LKFWQCVSIQYRNKQRRKITGQPANAGLRGKWLLKQCVPVYMSIQYIFYFKE